MGVGVSGGLDGEAGQWGVGWVQVGRLVGRLVWARRQERLYSPKGVCMRRVENAPQTAQDRKRWRKIVRVGRETHE